jgi:hypothetical protein
MRFTLFVIASIIWTGFGFWMTRHMGGRPADFAFGMGFGSLLTFADFRLAPKDGWRIIG